MTAFFDLSTCRQFSDGIPGYIPWNVIAEYADRAELEPDVAAGFIRVIRTMDSVFIEWHAAKQKALMEKNNPKSKAPTRYGRF